MRISIESLYHDILPAIRGIFSQNSPVVVNITKHESSGNIPETQDSYNKWKEKNSAQNSLYLINSLSNNDILQQIKLFENKLTKDQKKLSTFIFLQDIGLINVWPGQGGAYKDDEKETIGSGFEKTLKRLDQKVVIITGGAQGFGEGIAIRAFEEGAHVIIADLNKEMGNNLVRQYNSKKDIENRMIYTHADITDEDSVKNLMQNAVDNFGGIDVLISNAGVLRAGGLDELKIGDFDFVTEVNYKGFYLCVKYASRIMKAQNKYNQAGYSDIIQINSKSGLQGSQKNFAYSGSKFGSVGLVQSFALELVEDRVKVNAICPGNYFDGPLWSDPQNGLFVQYLRAGKVKGAKNIDDVKSFYESKVPMNRGVSVDDVMTAIMYAIDQKYETGQAIPVTGGQVMR